MCIRDSHECNDGSGYPLGLKGSEMSTAAQVVALVNFTDNLCNPADMGRAMKPHDELSYLFAPCRSKFDAQALQLLIRSLGVHPPGSILLLSNQALAVVTSVNPKKPLRPWVLVYDENVPKDQALTLNLEQEPQLSVITVSYTHLDVYKRQVQLLGDLPTYPPNFVNRRRRHHGFKFGC